jgi:hypothetical protein
VFKKFDDTGLERSAKQPTVYAINAKGIREEFLNEIEYIITVQDSWLISDEVS